MNDLLQWMKLKFANGTSADRGAPPPNDVAAQKQAGAESLQHASGSDQMPNYDNEGQPSIAAPLLPPQQGSSVHEARPVEPARFGPRLQRYNT